MSCKYNDIIAYLIHIINAYISFFIKNNLKIDQIDGIKYDPIIDQWKISKDTSVNYISKFIKV